MSKYNESTYRRIPQVTTTLPPSLKLRQFTDAAKNTPEQEKRPPESNDPLLNMHGKKLRDTILSSVIKKTGWLSVRSERQRNFAKINEYERNKSIVFSSSVSVSLAHFFTFLSKLWYPEIDLESNVIRALLKPKWTTVVTAEFYGLSRTNEYILNLIEKHMSFEVSVIVLCLKFFCVKCMMSWLTKR